MTNLTDSTVDELRGVFDKDDNLIGVLGAGKKAGQVMKVGAGRPTLRNVARQCYFPNEAWTLDNFTSRSRHRVHSPVTFIRLGWANARIGAVSSVIVETSDSDINNFEAAIEYPVGTFTRVTFKGATSTSIAAGAYVESDDIPIFVPEGADIYVRTYGVCASGKLTTVFMSPYPADNDASRLEYGTTAAPITNKVMGGTLTNTNQYVQFRPTVILSMSTKAAYWLDGDSRMVGQNDTLSGARPVVGQVEPSVYAAGVAYTKAARSGQKLSEALAAYKLRGYLVSRYHTHIITNLGINDLTGAISSVDALVANHAKLRAQFPDHWLATMTLPPETTGTYTTLDGQTPSARAPSRDAYNALLLSGALDFDAVYDLNAVAEAVNSRGEKVWKAGYAVDGLHENQTGNNAYAASKVFEQLPKT